MALVSPEKLKKTSESWPLVYMRVQIYIDIKKELDCKLCQLPGGNLDLIHKVYHAIDNAIHDEMQTLVNANSKIESEV